MRPLRSFIFAALSVTLSFALHAQPQPTYEIYAIRYATLPGFAVSGLVEGAEPSRKLDIAMMIWLVRGGGRNILFDSGFYREQFMKQWHPADYVKPSEAIAKLGLKPEDITDVIISHMHWTMPTVSIFSRRRRSGYRRTSWNTTRERPGNRGARMAASMRMMSWRR